MQARSCVVGRIIVDAAREVKTAKLCLYAYACHFSSDLELQTALRLFLISSFAARPSRSLFPFFVLYLSECVYIAACLVFGKVAFL